MTAKPVVFVTRKLPEAVEARLGRDYEARLNPDDRLYTADELVEWAAGADAIQAIRSLLSAANESSDAVTGTGQLEPEEEVHQRVNKALTAVQMDGFDDRAIPGTEGDREPGTAKVPVLLGIRIS